MRPRKPALTFDEKVATNGLSLRDGAHMVSTMRGAYAKNVPWADRRQREVSPRWLRFERLRLICDKTPTVTKPQNAADSPLEAEARRNAKSREARVPDSHPLGFLERQRVEGRRMAEASLSDNSICQTSVASDKEPAP